MRVFEAQERVEAAVLRSITARHYADPAHQFADAESEYADEQLALAARELVRAIDALPEGKRPIGWDAEVAS